jgi:hypothetical protein
MSTVEERKAAEAHKRRMMKQAKELVQPAVRHICKSGAPVVGNATELHPDRSFLGVIVVANPDLYSFALVALQDIIMGGEE